MKVGLAPLCIGSLLVVGLLPSSYGQGIIVPSAGPINSSMAGASTAAPVDFGGSYWNPAILSGLDSQEVLIGSALALPSIHLQSSVSAGSVGGLFPPTNRFGEARSDSGVAAGLATGFSFRMDGRIAIDLGARDLRAGRRRREFQRQLPGPDPDAPPAAELCRRRADLRERLAPRASTRWPRCGSRIGCPIGVGPIITAGTPSFNPAFFAPGPKGPLGLPTFPAATNARPYWGGGFQVGLLYELNEDWNLGFSYKSPIWQERWDFNSSYPNLAPRRIGVQASLPEIISWGIAYKGLPRTLIDVDLRYFDYANTSLFGTKVVDGGLGWQSVFAVAVGAQYQATDRLMLRSGYLYNTNPIRNEATLFNVQAPGSSPIR